jgi:transposase
VKKKIIPGEAIANLRIRLEKLSPRSGERVALVEATAETYGVSIASVYRTLNEKRGPKSTRRSDQGRSRKLSITELHQYCEIIAALKVRTLNKKGRHISTARALELLETCGIETPDGLVKAAPGLLSKSFVNRYLKQLGLHLQALQLEPQVVRFQAENSNDCWQFDISRSDLKDIPEPPWIDPSRGKPKPMLFSVIDDRSGACYQEYLCVYGEELDAVLRFLFRAMSPKDDFPFQGIPKMIYSDNGPFAKSAIFKRVMECLEIKFQSHDARDTDGRRTTARSKGKVERGFRTIKEAHEVLYHFHKPSTEEEANLWLHQHLYRHFNQRLHRSENHSRIEDWLSNLPGEGYRQMCSWEKFCSFAREPVERMVSDEAKVSLDGIDYSVSGELMGLEVTVLLGVLDNQINIEHKGVEYGPYHPADGPIPLHTYRKATKTKREKQADKIEDLAKKISVPKSALTGMPDALPMLANTSESSKSIPFPEHLEAADFANPVEAKLAIAHYLGRPIGGMADESRSFIGALVLSTLNKREILSKIKSYFAQSRKGDRRAH